MEHLKIVNLYGKFWTESCNKEMDFSGSKTSIFNLASGATWTMLGEAIVGLVTTIGVSRSCKSSTSAAKPEDKRAVVADKYFDTSLTGLGVLSTGMLGVVGASFIQHFYSGGSEAKSWVSGRSNIMLTVGGLVSIAYIVLGAYLYKAKCEAASNYIIATLASGSVGLVIIVGIAIFGMAKKKNYGF